MGEVNVYTAPAPNTLDYTVDLSFDAQWLESAIKTARENPHGVYAVFKIIDPGDHAFYKLATLNFGNASGTLSRHSETNSDHVRVDLSLDLLRQAACAECEGKGCRLSLVAFHASRGSRYAAQVYGGGEVEYMIAAVSGDFTSEDAWSKMGRNSFTEILLGVTNAK